MATSLRVLTSLAIAIAAIQVAFATYTYYPPCDPPHGPQYGGYGPIKKSYAIGSKIKYHCNDGYRLYGASWTVCKFNKRSYWTYPAPVCKPIKCHDLDDITYGGVKVSSYSYGSTVNYYCKKGYRLYGDATRKCQYNGYWTGKAPVCKPIICLKPDDILYGGIKMTGNRPGSRIQYYCNKGYRLYGDEYRECLYTGYWGGKAPVCKPIKCRDLDKIEYGGVKVSTYHPGSLAQYYCNKGYTLYGNEYRECLYTGYWGGKKPVCKPIVCHDLDNIKYGGVKVTNRHYGSRAQYYCNKGYKLYGDEYRECLYNGYWGGKAPVCKPIICHDLDDIKYGGVRLTRKHYGSRAQYYCNKGYKLYGDEYRECLYTGYWGGKAPVCKPIICHDLDDIKYGGVKLSSKHYGSRAQYYCNKGYKLYGDEYRVCLYNGYWGGKAPVCKPIRCHDLDKIEYGGVKVSSYKYGSHAQYYCNKGYKLVGDKYRECLYNGYWGGKAPVCKPIPCPHLDNIKYGGVKLTTYHPGSRAQYYCNKGYKLYGDEYRQCIHGGYWGGKEPVCKPIICLKLDHIPYGGVKVSSYKYGSRAHYYCNKGYKLVGDEYRECLYNGYWGGKVPVCKPIKCPELDDIEYGGVKVSYTSPGSTAHYYCEKHHKLVGDRWRKCQYDGTWTGVEPVCKKILCKKLDHPQYGKVKVDTYHPSSKAIYSCDDGYYLQGLSWRKCLSDGSWYGKPPVCLKKTVCPHPPAPKYGQARVTGYTPHSKVYYSCDRGYKLDGLQWRKCLKSGSWYGEAPVCRPVKYH